MNFRHVVPITALVFLLIGLHAPARAAAVLDGADLSATITDTFTYFDPALGPPVVTVSTDSFTVPNPTSWPDVGSDTLRFGLSVTNKSIQANARTDFGELFGGTDFYSVVLSGLPAGLFFTNIASGVTVQDPGTTFSFSIVGATVPSQVAYDVSVSAVPLPASLPLFGAALLGFTAFGARKMRFTRI